MIEERGNLWTLDADARCITTNGDVNKDFRAVMGRGVARQAKTRYPGLDRWLATMIKDHGNVPHILVDPLREGGKLVSFPVKHHWHEQADTKLIIRSCDLLMEMIDREQWNRVLLPRPGCGNGGLSWNLVRSYIYRHLDDRVVVIDL